MGEEVAGIDRSNQPKKGKKWLCTLCRALPKMMFRHGDRERSATQTASLIAASSRT